MVAFFVPTDIGNRALQHVGSERITTSDFSENTIRCAEVAFCYDKLRTAELERNNWEFAIRRVILRAVDTNTMLLSPSLWNGSAVYYGGSIVTDSSGNLWQSRFQNNTGNQPGIVWAAWEPYFGPLTVSQYDPTASYSPGEVVYTLAGDGTYNVYLSLSSSNAVDPSLSNQWSSITTYFQGDVVQQFASWASGTTYPAGQGVIYADGNWYASLVGSNLNNPPTSNPTKWALIPALVLQSLQVPAPNSPVTPPTLISPTPVAEWSITQTYIIGSFVQFKGSQYVSIANANTGNFPNAAASTFWALVTAGTLYQSLFDLNLSNQIIATGPGGSSAQFSMAATGTPAKGVAIGNSFKWGAVTAQSNPLAASGGAAWSSIGNMIFDIAGNQFTLSSSP